MVYNICEVIDDESSRRVSKASIKVYVLRLHSLEHCG